jgi:hypothetical protein
MRLIPEESENFMSSLLLIYIFLIRLGVKLHISISGNKFCYPEKTVVHVLDRGGGMGFHKEDADSDI